MIVLNRYTHVRRGQTKIGLCLLLLGKILLTGKCWHKHLISSRIHASTSDTEFSRPLTIYNYVSGAIAYNIYFCPELFTTMMSSLHTSKPQHSPTTLLFTNHLQPHQNKTQQNFS